MATISQQLIAGLQSPSMLAPLGKAAQAIGYYPTQLKKQGMLEQIQNAKTEEERAQKLIEYGKLSRNDNMVLQGSNMLAQAKQSGVANQVASLTNVLSNPILNKDQSDQLRSHIEQYASKAGLNLAPVISGMNTAETRRDANLNQEAFKAVDSGMSRAQFNQKYTGQGAKWDAARTARYKQDQAFQQIENDNLKKELNRLEVAFQKEAQRPTGQRDKARMLGMENNIVSLKQRLGDTTAPDSVGMTSSAIASQRLLEEEAATKRNETIEDYAFNFFRNKNTSDIPDFVTAPDGKQYKLTPEMKANVQERITKAIQIDEDFQKARDGGELPKDYYRIVKDFELSDPEAFNANPALKAALKTIEDTNGKTESVARKGALKQLQDFVEKYSLQQLNVSRSDAAVKREVDVFVQEVVGEDDEVWTFRDESLAEFLSTADEPAMNAFKRNLIQYIKENPGISASDMVNNPEVRLAATQYAIQGTGGSVDLAEEQTQVLRTQRKNLEANRETGIQQIMQANPGISKAKAEEAYNNAVRQRRGAN